MEGRFLEILNKNKHASNTQEVDSRLHNAASSLSQTDIDDIMNSLPKTRIYQHKQILKKIKKKRYRSFDYFLSLFLTVVLCSWICYYFFEKKAQAVLSTDLMALTCSNTIHDTVSKPHIQEAKKINTKDKEDFFMLKALIKEIDIRLKQYDRLPKIHTESHPVARICEDMQPQKAAKHLELLDINTLSTIFGSFSKKKASSILEYLSSHKAKELITFLSKKEQNN